MDYFEIDRLIEDLAKINSTALATSWFRLLNKGKPSIEEYRFKVIEFMNYFRNTLELFPDDDKTRLFKDHFDEMLSKEIKKILDGNNKEVDKRYKYFINYL